MAHYGRRVSVEQEVVINIQIKIYKPMIKKEIADKLFKTELAEQKVELSLISDRLTVPIR